MKSFNVYGYGMCCCASARIEQMARYLGLQARGYGINAHSVPEVCWDNEWHLLDASLANYFTRSDGKISSLSDITQAIQGWLQEHPDCRGNGAKLDQIQRADGWTGWKRGPALLANCAFYDSGGCWPARTHGWASTMQEYDGSHGTPFPFEYGYSQGYEVNIQLRRGERLTRNWFNNGLHVNGVLKDGDTPGCLTAKVGEGSLVFLRGLATSPTAASAAASANTKFPWPKAHCGRGRWRSRTLPAKSRTSSRRPSTRGTRASQAASISGCLRATCILTARLCSTPWLARAARSGSCSAITTA